jgi:hypothetical protein
MHKTGALAIYAGPSTARQAVTSRSDRSVSVSVIAAGLPPRAGARQGFFHAAGRPTAKLIMTTRIAAHHTSQVQTPAASLLIIT